jgi:hypothetical protein
MQSVLIAVSPLWPLSHNLIQSKSFNAKPNITAKDSGDKLRPYPALDATTAFRDGGLPLLHRHQAISDCRVGVED